MYIGKKLRRLIAASVAVGALIFPPPFDNFNFVSTAQAEVKTYTGEGEATMGESETLEKVIERAKKYAMRDAIEKAGVYISSHSELHNSELEDKIITLAGGKVKIVDSDKEIVSKDNSVKVLATVTITIDADDLQKEIDKYFEKNTKKVKIEISQEKIENKTPELDNIALSAKKFNEGFRLCINRNFSEAVPILNEAVKLNPNNSDAYRELGWAYTKLGDYNKALFYRKKAVELNPDDLYALEGIAWAYNELKEYDKAIEVCNKGIDFHPEFEPFYHTRGNAYSKLKNYSQSVLDFTKAIELKPDLAWVYNSRGCDYIRLGNYNKAYSDINKAIQLEPNNASYHDCLGWYYNCIGEYNKSILECDKAIKIDQNHSFAYHTRGEAYRGLKKYKLAIVEYDKSIRIKSDWAAVYFHRAECYQALGEMEKANADFEKARQIGWND